VIDRVKGQRRGRGALLDLCRRAAAGGAGKLVSLSGDAMLGTTSTGVSNSYYLARVEITADGLKALGHRAVQPGMPVEVLIKTGERPLLTYLLHPLLKRVSASMTEQ
jgi:protease secretion system membrane fusion protein